MKSTNNTNNTNNTPEVNTRHYYKPNMKFIPRTLTWLMDNTAYPVIIPNRNYILRKEDTPHPNASAPDLLEYYVEYRPLSELTDDPYYAEPEYIRYNRIFRNYTFDGTPIKEILNTIADNLYNDKPIIDEYKKYINSIESFKEAVFLIFVYFLFLFRLLLCASNY